MHKGLVILRSALETVGLDAKNVTGHSFHIGAATTAAERRLEDSTIKALGRWHSSAYLAYVRLKSHLFSVLPRRSRIHWTSVGPVPGVYKMHRHVYVMQPW